MNHFQEFFTNPINVGLLLLAGYLIYDLLKPEEPFVAPAHPKVIVKRDFTPKQLMEFNGENGKPIYLAVGGNVYDVSSKPDFYGPGSMYANFAGRDASRGMAKNSFDPEVLTDLEKPIDLLEDLNEEERKSLQEWSEFFSGNSFLPNSMEKGVRRSTQNYKFLGLLTICALFYLTLNPTKSSMTCPIEEPSVSPIAQTRARLSSLLPKNGTTLILLPSAPRYLRPESDMELPGWRQTSNIVYLLGKYEISDSFILINQTNGRFEISAFIPQLKQREIVFNGDVPDLGAIKQDYGLNNVYYVNQLPAVLHKSKVLSPSAEIMDFIPKSVKDALKKESVAINYSEKVEQLFNEARFLKTEAELELLRFASRAAFYSHQMVEKAIQSWSINTESTLASYFELVSTTCYCRLQAYNPIVGAGKHSGVLHYPTGESNDGGFTKIPEEDYILIDAAGAYNGYASDITRTYLQRPNQSKQLLIDIVREANRAGIKQHKLGNKWSTVVDASLHQLTKGLWEHGFLVADSLDELINSGVISIFMPHGLGHPVGLDVHDPYPSKFQLAEAQGLTDEYPLKLAHDYALAKGQVHTIEPGVYFVPYLLEMAKNETLGVKKYINWAKIEEWKNVGGVRVEDVVAIDWNGNSLVLSGQ